MSMYGIEHKIAKDSIPRDMPRRFKEACYLALQTNILNLRHKSVTAKELDEHVIPFLNAHPNISGFNISTNTPGATLGIEEVRLLLKCTYLYNLSIAQNNLGDEAAEILATHPAVQVLDISENALGAAGASALAKSNIKCLNISNNNIGDLGLQAFAKNRSFLLLDASRNNISGVGVTALAEILTLKHLNLSSNPIGDHDFRAFSGHVRLKLLNVTACNIGNVGASGIAKIPLVVLLCSHNVIGSIGTQDLANSKTLQVLDISHNKIEDNGVLELIKSPSIHTLHLEETSISPDGMKAFEEFILSGANAALTSVPDMKISSAIEEVLQLNTERANPQESQKIKMALESVLHAPIISLICEYRGETKDFDMEFKKIALQDATQITWKMPHEYAYFSMRRTFCLPGKDTYLKQVHGVTLEEQTQGDENGCSLAFKPLTFQAPNHSITPEQAAKESFLLMMQYCDISKESLEYDLSNGIDINAFSDKGETALMLVAKRGNVAGINLLLLHGADAGLLDPKGNTAFDLAAQLGHDEEVLEALKPKNSLSPN